ncbi:ribonuclease-3 [Sporobacter termitidis DSM 10068]|uniref:Ribonuclease 3 n=1 Tax=Sporobacter termitidis DSM 10068 TaxID=1123282 RepID=A0A1M5UL51_9FIRM|nr:ribonuclease III [Sporobacter termitidis]SHH63588.1 ribonuclease-3 [Sporobacter termitidis DSM 10068]
MDKLEEKLGYVFRDGALLKTALTHSSWANENKKSGLACNERLEFLGDSILGFTVAEFLYQNEPDMPEGQMTRIRAELVCERSLENAANTLELGACLKLGRGEELGGGRRRPSILADAFEAVVAAVFLDGGIDAAKAMVTRFVLSGRDEAVKAACDYKTLLQELVQRKSGQTLSYHMIGESGPDHMKQFSVEVRLNGEARGAGTGRNKKEAEQAAARVAYEAMMK